MYAVKVNDDCNDNNDSKWSILNDNYDCDSLTMISMIIIVI